MGYHGYEQVMADLYDDDYAVARTPSGDVDFYVEQAKRAGGPVIEFGCGTGRILVPSAEAGVPMTGVDSSPAMLEKARGKIAARALDAQLVQGQIQSATVDGSFALATLPFRVIAHLESVEEQLAAFENVHRHLEPGGRVVVDFFHPRLDILCKPWGPRVSIDREDGKGGRVRRIDSGEADVAAQVTNIQFLWELEDAQGEVEKVEARISMRWYYRFELEHLLARTGFEIEEIYGDFRGRSFENGCPEMVFVARRPRRAA